ncbi:OsmC family protein [Nakamurella flava]|uniref:OsmC family protein n=1 Tax=Nakamurella flava TaxID=2576308 RepID=A0A4U6QFG0_9ACTN|nr:OsmC family protein [Nakamurella flava]TKV58831.1 OsmC family protein [Nakamurella flava]
MTDSNARSVEVTRLGPGRWQATNPRGGRIDFGDGETDSFTPVELLLAAIGGCSAIDVDMITGKRATADEFTVRVSGDKIRDEHGNRMTDLQAVFDLVFPEGAAGDKARSVLARAIEQSRDRLCTVSRTVTVASPVEMRPA